MSYSIAKLAADPSRELVARGAPSPGPELVFDPVIDRFDLTYLLRKHWWKLALAPLIGCLIGFSAYRAREPLYEGSAVVLVEPSFQELIRVENVGSGHDDLAGLRSLEIALVADSVILGVVEKLGLRKEAGFLPPRLAKNPELSDSELVSFLRENRISSALLPDTRLIKISVLDSDPDRAQRMAQAFTSEFEELVSEQREAEVLRATKDLELRSERARHAALASEQKLKEYRDKNPGLPVEQDNDLFNARITRLGEELNQITEERRKLGSQKHTLEGIDPDQSPLEVIDIAQYRDVEHVSRLLEAVAQSRSNFTVVAKDYLQKHPIYQKAKAEVDRNESLLKDLAKEIISTIQVKHASALMHEREVTEELAALTARIGEAKERSSEFRALQQQTERDWGIHQALQTKLGERALATARPENIATVVSGPLRPHDTANPGLLLYLGLGGGIGMLLGGGWLGWLILAGLPYSNPRQLEERTGLPIVVDWTKSPSVDGVQSTRLLQLLAQGNDQTIQVSAPHFNGAGRAVASHVARLAASHGRKTLLVLVKSDEVHCEFEPTDLSNLMILELAPETILDLNKFPAGLNTLKHSFDHIVFDASQSEDPDIVEFLASHTDLEMIVVGKDTTKKQLVEDRVAKLSRGHQSDVAIVMVPPPARFARYSLFNTTRSIEI